MPSVTPNEASEEDIYVYLEILNRLREEKFNKATNAKLAKHPYLIAAKEGKLTLAQRRAFAGEQYAIQHSDAISFAHLAGHGNFHPLSLSVATLPEHESNNAVHEDGEKTPDLFQFLLGGELFASKLLLNYAKSVGFENEEAIKQYPLTAKAQAYPSYWSRLAISKQRGAGAAACAVNFAAWGKMCGELALALKSRPEYGYASADNAKLKVSLAFIDFFATPIENLDQMAAKIMQQEKSTFEDVVTGVRLLQEFEVMFWDAIHDAK